MYRQYTPALYACIIVVLQRIHLYTIAKKVILHRQTTTWNACNKARRKRTWNIQLMLAAVIKVRKHSNKEHNIATCVTSIFHGLSFYLSSFICHLICHLECVILTLCMQGDVCVVSDYNFSILKT